MQRLAAFLIVAVAPAALAADTGVRPGLWEVRVVRQVVDGSDVSAQLASAATQVKQALSNLPAEQREKLEAALRDNSLTVSDDGSYRACVTPEMASHDFPALDAGGRCTPSEQRRSGDRVDFEFSCDTDAGRVQGKGQAVIAGDRITTKVHTHSTDPSGGQHEIESETEMHFVAADCGKVKPREAQR